MGPSNHLRVKKKETKYQKIKRLQKEINESHNEINRLEKEAVGEIIEAGITRIAKEHGEFQITDVNHLMVSGHFDHPDTKEFNSYFELDTMTKSIRSGQVGQFHIFVQAANNHTELQISWPQDKVSHPELKAKLHENVSKVRQFFLKYKIPVGALPIENKRARLLAEVAVLDTLIRGITISQVLTG